MIKITRQDLVIPIMQKYRGEMTVSPKVAHCRFLADLHKISKPVAQFDLEGIYLATYSSAAHASRSVKTHPANISNAARGKTNTCKGFFWKYVGV